MEIERKWLLKDKPNLLGLDEYIVNQAYLVANPHMEVRIREAIRTKIAHHIGIPDLPSISPYKLTIKDSLSNLARNEIEIEITEDQYNQLLSLIPYPAIDKHYYIYVPEFDLVHPVEISHVDNDWWYCEVEFVSVEDAKNYVLPHAVNLAVEREITNEPEFKMKNYWLSSRVNKSQEG